MVPFIIYFSQECYGIIYSLGMVPYFYFTRMVEMQPELLGILTDILCQARGRIIFGAGDLGFTSIRKILNISINPRKLSIFNQYFRNRSEVLLVTFHQCLPNSSNLYPKSPISFFLFHECYLPWSDGMRCCKSDWPGLCLFCCYQTSCVFSQQS